MERTKFLSLAQDFADEQTALRGGKSPAAFGKSLRRYLAAGMPSIEGAADQPVHPLGAPSVSGTTITVDLMLNQPTRITKMISDLTLQRFVADRIFSSGGGVTGGAVIYDEAVRNELYTTRDVERVEPGAEFPTVQAERFVPKVAEVEKWGGKVWIPDESRDRNQSSVFTNKVRQLANTIVRKINQRAIAVLDASITASGQTITLNNWTTIVTGGSSQSNASLWPAADIAHIAQSAEEDELGINYTLLLLNPAQYAQLTIIYGAQGLSALLSALGMTIYVSNRVPSGKLYAVAEGQVGEMRVEKPLGSETWREEKRQRTWVQSDVRPLMFVDNPFAVMAGTGMGV